MSDPNACYPIDSLNSWKGAITLVVGWTRRSIILLSNVSPVRGIEGQVNVFTICPSDEVTKGVAERELKGRREKSKRSSRRRRRKRRRRRRRKWYVKREWDRKGTWQFSSTILHQDARIGIDQLKGILVTVHCFHRFLIFYRIVRLDISVFTGLHKKGQIDERDRRRNICVKYTSIDTIAKFCPAISRPVRSFSSNGYNKERTGFQRPSNKKFRSYSKVQLLTVVYWPWIRCRGETRQVFHSI